ncbi:HNH endonuclease [Pseudonocardia sp. P1]
MDLVDDAWTHTDEELLLTVGSLQRAIDEASAALVPLVAEVATRGLAEAQGHRDVAHLLRSVQNVSLRTARARVRAAEQLAPTVLITGQQVDPRLPELAAAFGRAEVSAEHVDVIQRVLAALPPHLDEHRAPLEADLVEHARGLDPDGVEKLGRRALALLDPDGPRPREPHPTRNRLTLRPQGSGFAARGWFDTESAAVLRTALSPLSAPVPPVEAGCDDAGEPIGRDERSAAERNGDGLVELARMTIATGALGSERGQEVRVTVTVPLEALTTGRGAAQLGFGDGLLTGAVDAGAALRLACDAEVVPVVLGTHGEPLFVGRGNRLANRGQRRALAQRDGGCAFPGCDRPPQWCSAHHVEHWADGGPTDLDNLVLLCGHHHSMIHKGDWTVTMDGGFPLFHPPPWVAGGSRRNPVHRAELVGRVAELCPQ